MSFQWDVIKVSVVFVMYYIMYRYTVYWELKRDLKLLEGLKANIDYIEPPATEEERLALDWEIDAQHRCMHRVFPGPRDLEWNKLPAAGRFLIFQMRMKHK